MVNNSQPSVLVCINEFAGTNYHDFLLPLLPKLPSLKKFIFLGKTAFPDAIDFDDLITEEIDTTLLAATKKKVIDTKDNFIIYTSGTTGRPKGAVLTQKSIMAMVRPWARNMELNIGDKMLDVLPLNHVGGGTIIAFGTLAAGATLVMHDMFIPDNVLDMIANQEITAIGAVPTIYAIFFSLPTFNKEKLAPLQLAAYGGAAASPELLEKMKTNMENATIMACYGATEVSGFCTYTTLDDPIEKIMNTVGRAPSEVQIKIVEPEKRTEVPVGEIGEVAVRGDLLIDRYLGLPEETDKVFDADGWYYAGDMGYVDDNEYLTLVGRYKEMYITGGYNVYPPEIEDSLMEHPAVAMTAVIGVPHKIKGEVGWAFVMKKPGTDVTEEELIEHCKKKVADYKVPAKVIIENVLPMTALGKLDKMSLKTLAMKELGK
jgi:fatty-acyl-CoA synthase